MRRAAKRREAYWEGFHDALVYGARDPAGGVRPDWHAVAYGHGYADGQRAVERIVDRAVGTALEGVTEGFERGVMRALGEL